MISTSFWLKTWPFFWKNLPGWWDVGWPTQPHFFGLHIFRAYVVHICVYFVPSLASLPAHIPFLLFCLLRSWWTSRSGGSRKALNWRSGSCERNCSSWGAGAVPHQKENPSEREPRKDVDQFLPKGRWRQLCTNSEAWNHIISAFLLIGPWGIFYPQLMTSQFHQQQVQHRNVNARTRIPENLCRKIYFAPPKF